MQRIHHLCDRRKNNYGDIVRWDMLFEPYENPQRFTASGGFNPEKAELLLAMIAFNDIHT